MSDVRISAQVTPNPNTLKFMLDMLLFDKGSYNFENAEAAKTSPLPSELFEIEGIDGVMVGTNFVSVTKNPDIDWADLAEPIITTIKGVIAEEDVYIDESVKTQHDGKEDSEAVTKIKHILDTEIRPAVAMDGGDITFHDYTDGILTLHLQGACSTCPSSIMTLQMGVEARLKEDIPDLKEVVQV